MIEYLVLKLSIYVFINNLLKDMVWIPCVMSGFFLLYLGSRSSDRDAEETVAQETGGCSCNVTDAAATRLYC